MKKYGILFLLCGFAPSCEGGRYANVNPPMDGVIIGGDPNNVAGYKRVGVDSPNATCPDPKACFLGVSNRSFMTLYVNVGPYLTDPTVELGVRVSRAKNSVIYVYRQNGKHLERDNRTYNRGILPSGVSYNLTSLMNEMRQEILQRGIFPLGATGFHHRGFLLAYLTLTSPVADGEKLSVCVAPLDKSAADLSSRSPQDCFSVSY